MQIVILFLSSFTEMQIVTGFIKTFLMHDQTNIRPTKPQVFPRGQTQGQTHLRKLTVAFYKLLRERTRTACIIKTVPSKGVGRDRVAGIATRYGLDGPGIESR